LLTVERSVASADICWFCSILFTCWFGCWWVWEVYVFLEWAVAIQSVVCMQIHSRWNWIQLCWAIHDASESLWVAISLLQCFELLQLHAAVVKLSSSP